MSYAPKNNYGALFKNERKTDESHPDYTGSIMIENQEYYLDVWVKRQEGKKTYMAVHTKKKKAAQKPTSADQETKPAVKSQLPPPPPRAR